MIHIFKNRPNQNQQKSHDTFFKTNEKLAKKVSW